jgi:hypothetical protein
MRYRGQVVKKPFGVGSKSEHAAVKLVTGEREYVLRRQGGNPFSDPVLDALVGKTIECDGIVHDYTLIMSTWREA